MRRALLAAVAALAASAAPASAQMHHDHGATGGSMVDVEFAAFAPPAIDVLAGEPVTWSNASVRRHDVAAVDGSFNSGSLFAGATYRHAFDRPGVVPYFCTLHPFMRGTIAVHDLLLTAPAEPGAPGRPFAVRGRTALPTGTRIAIEEDSGSGFAEIADTTAGDDGTFTATLRPKAAGRLRAVAAGVDASPDVPFLVLDRKVSAMLRGGRVRAVVAPGAPGATVVLQMFLRERFGWWPVKSGKLDGKSSVSFRVRPRKAVRARVVLTLADGATPLAISQTLRLPPVRSYRSR
jgi:plastocyanin